MPLDRIPKGKVIACDTETTGVYPWTGARPFYFSFCNPEGETGRFRWKVDPFTRKPIPIEADIRQMKDFFEDERITKVFHVSKFDIRMLQFTGIEVRGRVEDTYFAAHTLRTNEMTHALKPLAKKYVGFSDADEKTLDKEVSRLRRKAKAKGWNIGQKGRDGKNPIKTDMWLASDEFLDPYGCGDVERTILLWKVFEDALNNDPACRKFYERELRLQKVTMEMEARGVRVKHEIIVKEIKNQNAEIERCKKILQKEIGQDFNSNSPLQVSAYIYKTLGMPVRHWTDSGQPSVDAKALQEIDHPTVKVLRQHNSAEKAISNFFQKYLDTAVLDEEGCWILHPDFNQVGPATGRYSCRNPNLQNAANALSTRSDIPIQARTPFCPRPGYVWLSADYSGEEIWIFADGSNGDAMLRALYDGRDLHSDAARFIWGDEQVDREKREGRKTSRAKAKMFFFGILYGMQEKSMAAFLDCPRSEARATLRRYYTLYPNVETFMDFIQETVRRQGFIQTAWGRKIFVDPDFAYKATNYYVQGTGADVIKDAMIRVNAWFKKEKLDAHIVMTIHDELVVEIRKDLLTRAVAEKIRALMEDHGGNLKIKKLPVELALVTKRWDQKEEHLDTSKLG